MDVYIEKFYYKDKLLRITVHQNNAETAKGRLRELLEAAYGKSTGDTWKATKLYLQDEGRGDFTFMSRPVLAQMVADITAERAAQDAANEATASTWSHSTSVIQADWSPCRAASGSGTTVGRPAGACTGAFSRSASTYTIRFAAQPARQPWPSALTRVSRPEVEGGGSGIGSPSLRTPVTLYSKVPWPVVTTMSAPGSSSPMRRNGPPKAFARP